VTTPDLQFLCQSCASYQINLQGLCEQFDNKSAQDVEESSLSNEVFAAVYSNRVNLYDLQSGQLSQYKIDEDFGAGTSYIQVDRETLVCLGGLPSSTDVSELNLSDMELSPMPSLHTPRAYAGAAEVASVIYVFGGQNSSYEGLKSCEKYEDCQWFPLNNMQEQRHGFTPCTFRGLIYLPCAFTSVIEAFSPETELFSLLSVSFPIQLSKWLSVSFVARGNLCVLTGGKQLWQWKIGSRRKYRLSATEWSCWSSQPPRVMDSQVLIVNNGKVERFSLESYTFIS
jgi:hypothetical protein